MQSAAGMVRWLSVRNAGGETIPAFGLVRIVGADTDGTVLVDRPDADGQDVMVNGPVRVLAGGAGACTRDVPLYALYDPADGVPASGETWGASAGSFAARKNRSGLVIYGGADTARSLVLVDRPPGGVVARRNDGSYTAPARRRVSFKEGANVTITVADDATAGEVDVTIAANGAGPSFSLTVQESDGGPAVAGVDVVKLDQSDGLTLTDDGGGDVSITIKDATTTQAGIVSIGNQTWAGSKAIAGVGVGWMAISTDIFGGGYYASANANADGAAIWGYVYDGPTGQDHWYVELTTDGAGEAYLRLWVNDAGEGVLGVAGVVSGSTSTATHGRFAAWDADALVWREGVTTLRTFAGAGADAGKTITWRIQGGIVTGEWYTGASGSGSGGGGDTTETTCCPGVTLPALLTLTLPDLSTLPLGQSGSEWVVGDYRLACDVETWYLLVPGVGWVAADGGGSCDPFAQTFTAGGDTYEVTE